MGNKPRIRFKGFTEDWEQRKLIYIFNDFIVPMRDKPKVFSGTTPWTRIEDIEGRYINTSLSGQFVSDETIKSMNLKVIPKGSLIVSASATFGVVAIVNSDLITNQTFIGLVPNKDFDIDFLYSLFESPTTKSKLLKLSAGSTIFYIARESFENLVLLVPSKEEQIKISKIFKSIDDSITLHQCKLEKLKLTKKALLQKLFPKNGKHIPEIRFKGFTDAWEQRKFSDITYLSGVKNKENKPYESYSISNEFGFIPQDEQFENGGTMKTANKSMYYIVSQNSFAYNPARINVGSIGYYDKPDNVIVSSLYEVFKTTEIVNDKFLWHWFKSSQFNHLIEKYQEGGVRLYFYYDKLCKGTIELPTINEQNKISNLLDSLDMYITLHQRKLERLQEVKKGLLQKMFV
ncbi:restriction endonuclease subunit S [Solobacterium sp.]|uniref:restriction endonuclease subunit S n=1 Tax=Solobacterium sp. TaxID=2060878 RepID=UPI001CAD96E8|nr:restriction endonuclease subunit S [Solobacterium sp.]MBF1086278.1 restriction endonuclease subunit S [Solobacterium sp.]